MGGLWCLCLALGCGGVDRPPSRTGRELRIMNQLNDNISQRIFVSALRATCVSEVLRCGSSPTFVPASTEHNVLRCLPEDLKPAAHDIKFGFPSRAGSHVKAQIVVEYGSPLIGQETTQCLGNQGRQLAQSSSGFANSWRVSPEKLPLWRGVRG